MLDANALIDFLGDRPGGGRMKHLFADAVRDQNPLLMSVINWGGSLPSMERYREDSARQTISGMERLPIELVDVALPLVMQAAGIKAHHKIPYVDCIAGVLALTRKAVLVTSDRDF